MSLARAHTVGDLQRLAARRIPKMVREFVDGGAGGEVTLAGNRSDFDDVVFRPRFNVDVSARDQSVDVYGRRIPSPVMLAPAGLARLVHKGGELAAARAAAAAGTVFGISTASSFSIEEIAEASGGGALWFQLYLWKDQEVVSSLVRRADDAGYEALVLTVDVPIVGKRVRDLHNGMTIPPKIRPGNALDAARHLRWMWHLVTGERITFRNFLGMGDGDDATSLGTYVNKQMINPAANWDDLDWLRPLWDKPLVVKGILTAEDARIAVAKGADGVIVSNHGGRQLDGSPSSISALGEVVDAVGDRVPVFLDGGVRRGEDVVRAKALGARAVFVGRPWFWGLAAGGEAGVAKMLDILREEIDRTLALL
ncbi:MAG TPA: alpha-hydroxy acid oxidase, partial [Acidimicrobiia bacterium]|nr:alpha-hydroxy acid oxidase [Acidimicrobiia bacterium]